MNVLGIKSVRTACKGPWQNGIAERFVGDCRRDLLDHAIVLNERHFEQLMRDYVRYFHEDGTHLGLAKGTQLNAQKRVTPAPPAGLSPCRDWAACIIAANLPRELFEIYERWERPVGVVRHLPSREALSTPDSNSAHSSPLLCPLHAAPWPTLNR